MDTVDAAVSAPARAGTRAGASRTAADDGAVWAAFASAETAQAFCEAWLTLQCRMIPPAAAGLLLLDVDGGQFGPAAVWPSRQLDAGYLAAAAERALKERRGIVDRPAATAGGSGTHIAYPVDIRGRLYGVIVVDVAVRSDAELQPILRQLHWGAGWLEVLFRRGRAEEDGVTLARMAMALDTVATAQEHREPRKAAMAVANELTGRLGCRSVCIGERQGDRIRLLAVSNMAWFQDKAHAVAQVESAMEEAVDQFAAVAWPAAPETEGRIAVAHRDLAATTRSGVVLTALLTSRGEAVGAITVDVDEGGVMSPELVAMLESIGALLGPVLEQKAALRRWVAGRLVDTLAAWKRALLDPRRLAAKLLTAGIVAALVALALAKGDHTITADAVVEGAVQRAAVAPIDGFIEEAPVRAGDLVREGDLLARLDDKDLVLEALHWESEKAKYRQEYRDALAKHDRPAMRVLQAQLEQADAQLALIREQLERTGIRAPFAGVVVSGDLSQRLGTPVEKGAVLFEIAPLDAYRVILEVDERDVLLVNPDQPGHLALAAVADARLPFRVQKVTPVSTPAEGRNVFRVEAAMVEAGDQLRPGMEGVGKITVGRERLVWIWTRPLISWVRLQLWTWLP